MNNARREEIFSKELLSIDDIQELFGIGYQSAAKIIRDIKRGLTMNPKFKGQGLRLNIRGYVHTQDYLDYFGLKKKEAE